MTTWLMTMTRIAGAAIAATAMFASGDALAQTPPTPPNPLPPPGLTPVYPPGVIPLGDPLRSFSPAVPIPPREMDVVPDEPIPPGYHRVTRASEGLVIGGAATAAGLHVFNVVLAALAVGNGRDKSYAPLFAPLVGPFIAVGTIQPSGAGLPLLVIDGAVQLAGLGLMIIGFTARKPVLLRNDVVGRIDISPAPVPLGQGRVGFGIAGRM